MTAAELMSLAGHAGSSGDEDLVLAGAVDGVDVGAVEDADCGREARGVVRVHWRCPFSSWAIRFTQA